MTHVPVKDLARGTRTCFPGRNSPSRRQEALQPHEPGALANLKPCRESRLINSALWHPDITIWLLGPKLVFLPSSLLRYVIYLLGQRLLRGPQHRTGRGRDCAHRLPPAPRLCGSRSPSYPRPRVTRCYLEEYVLLEMHFPEHKLEITDFYLTQLV